MTFCFAWNNRLWIMGFLEKAEDNAKLVLENFLLFNWI